MLKKTIYDLTELLPLNTRPTTAAAIPPMSIHMDLSVGVPVKKRVMSEPNESDALIPKIINTIPATTSPSPRALFIICLSFVWDYLNSKIRFRRFQTERRPEINDTRNNIRKITKSIFAIAAAVPAIPTNPNTPAINAMTKNINDQLNIVMPFFFILRYPACLRLLKRPLCHTR
jgi:hypothetical protein